MVNYRDMSMVKKKIKKRINGNEANQTEVPELALSIHVSPHLSSMLHAIWRWSQGKVCIDYFCGMSTPAEERNKEFEDLR